ncbi:DMT family transporter [Shewanella intestini]|uniref:EamA family transporter n=1 Tax=Shewanella intestini TaxID=2017544 RepID=A0ABS5I349_9GAMM|nr:MULTISPECIES: DMT family transporter [Shewanella]MBR9728446.1 EamA family transporter [Shewanella intestini]MRG36788.1 EamA family transporter [Shewanella sp. XMDDZSB0408]
MKIFLAILAPILWGTTYAVVSSEFVGWSPFALSVWRALPAGLLLLLAKPTLPKLSELPALLLIGFLNIALFFGLLFSAAMQIPSSLVGVGMVALPVVGLAVMGILHQVKPSMIQLISALVLVSCSAYLFVTSSVQISLSAVLLLIGAMTALIGGSVVAKHAMKNIHWWKLLTWKLIFGGLLLIPMAYWEMSLSGQSFVTAIPTSGEQWVAMIWLIVGLTSVAYGVYIYTIPMISTNELSFFGTLNPILAMILGATLMDESFSVIQIVIMIIMVASNIIAQIIEYRKNLPTEQVIINY